MLIEQNQAINRVTIALKSLPPEQQDVVCLSFIHDMPHVQIAATVSAPLGTVKVKSRLHLAYGRLRPMPENLQ
ncbi:MAG: hypothetical protein MO846_10560 [Candidatus Devosia symbiotica]|nr:hypothetical protein [Candidatus Devosia symbiotica]